ncbi:MAG: SDR family NAD(P)-dependent oxidoreductase [Planctomycetota bacterium]
MRAIVTGGSSGVGRALALELSRRGARVLATARRRERLEELARFGDPPEPIAHEVGDICDPGFRRQLVTTAASRLGGLDLVVAAAGGGAVGGFRTARPETLARIIDLDLVAPAELVREALPHLARGRDAAVVLVGSILGLHPLPLHAEYCAAKAGLRSLARTLRLELAADNIGVLLATLGPVESEFWTALVDGERPGWSRGRGMPPERAAGAILSGLERRRAEVVPGWQAKGYAWLARWMPGLIDRWAAARWRTHDLATGATGDDPAR